MLKENFQEEKLQVSEVKNGFSNFPAWLTEDFQVCNVCGGILASDAGIQAITAGKTKYCKLCGMPTNSRSKFCCQSCEDKFEKFVKRRRRFKKWEKNHKE